MSSKSEHYVHLVWTTKGRQPLVTAAIERGVHRCLSNEVERLKCVVCAINGMPDHVHIIAALHTDVCVSGLLKRIKGVSSTMVNNLHDHQQRFRWQEGYYVRSISLSHLKVVIAYVRNQKQHHADGTLHPEWEETTEAIS